MIYTHETKLLRKERIKGEKKGENKKKGEKRTSLQFCTQTQYITY